MDTKQNMSAIIWLVLAGGIAVVIIIFMGLMGGITYDTTQDDLNQIGYTVVTNDVFVARTQTTPKADHGFIHAGTLKISNGTATGKRVGLGNFTIDYTAGTFKLINNPTYKSYNGSTMYLNYTWGIEELRGSIQAGITSGFDAQNKISKYLPLVILAIIIGIVLTIILGIGMARQNGGAGGSL